VDGSSVGLNSSLNPSKSKNNSEGYKVLVLRAVQSLQTQKERFLQQN
jgi:hypothetical protein